MLPGIAHSARSSALRTSRTVTRSPRSSMSLKIIASMLPSATFDSPVLALYRQPGRPPVGQPFPQPARPVATGPQQGHRLVGEHAVWTPTVRHDLPVPRYLLQIRLQPLHGDGARPRYVPGPVLLLRADVEDDYAPVAKALHQLRRVHGLQRIPVLEVGLDHP